MLHKSGLLEQILSNTILMEQLTYLISGCLGELLKACVTLSVGTLNDHKKGYRGLILKIHWELCRKYSLGCIEKWSENSSPSVVEAHAAYNYFLTDKHLDSNHTCTQEQSRMDLEQTLRYLGIRTS